MVDCSQNQAIGTQNNGGQHIHGPIIINNFGNENLDGVLGEITTMLDSMPEGLPGEAVLAETVRFIYGNQMKPQNRTVRITNKRDNIPSIRNGDIWEERTEAFLYPVMIEKACQTLQNNQNFGLGESVVGLSKLAQHGKLLRSAFDLEHRLKKDVKMAAEIIRPVLYSNARS